MALSEAQKRRRARRAFEAVARDAERLRERMEKIFPRAINESGDGNCPPEVMIGLGQAIVYSELALGMSDYGIDKMLEGFGGRRALKEQAE